jgi:hypothetical protein
MASLSQYLEDEILEWIKGTTFAAAPTTVYVDLLDSGDLSILNTIAGSANRQSITFGTITTDGTGRIMSNSADITFTASAVGSATAVAAAIYDAQTGGNQLAQQDLASSKAISSGDEVKFSAGNLTFKMD